MVHAQSPIAFPVGSRREGAGLTVAASIVLHAALGWAIVSLFVPRMLPEPADPLTIEIAPPMSLPAPAAPNISSDAPPVLPERPRSELAKPEPEAPRTVTASTPAQMSAVDAQSGVGIASGPVGPAASAPRPTYRADVDYPRRAQLAERNGIAVVEVLIAAGGGVSDVRLISETPGGYGFGDAALASVRQWRFETAQPGVYRVTVRFTLN